MEASFWLLSEAYVIPSIVYRIPRLVVPWTIYCAVTATDFVYIPFLMHFNLIDNSRVERWCFYGRVGMWVGLNLFAGEWFYSPIQMLGIDIK